ncbi:MAG: DUF11 domain-containing protein [Kiritimatiellae bacterium]|nr:DUF11 domain-containing protein [Kiritimatiellia bacterium]
MKQLRVLHVLTAGLLAAGTSVLADSTLGITKTAAPEPVRVGHELTYRIAVTNTGPDTATNVVVTDVLPAGLEFVSCSPSQGSYSNDAGTIYCSLGNMACGATTGVLIVTSPGAAGTITNEASVSAVNGAGGRAAAAATVLAANRPPEIGLPGPHILPVGSTTSFVVQAYDHDDYDEVTIINTVKPAGANYVGSNFTWAAGVDFENTTNTLTFVADDGQGETNSVVTNSTVIIVPYDWDADGLRDGWEWTHFQSLTNLPDGDHDGDGADNYTEYVAGTQPTNANSAFRVTDVIGTGASTEHRVEVATEPGLQYTIEFKDSLQSTWSPFANPANGIGTWLETNTVSTAYQFLDDEGAQTTGGPPPDQRRYYRVKVERL